MRKLLINGAGIFGFVSLATVLGLALFGNDKIICSLLSQEIALRDDTEAMERWRVTPQPVLFKVYLWNVTNREEVSAGEKPQLLEVGPYVYEQWLQKVDIKEGKNDTLSYKIQSKMIFNDNLSGCFRESDIVTVAHLPMLGMVLKVYEVMPDFLGYMNEVWSVLFPGLEDIFLTGTIKDILFDGITIDCSSKDFIVTTVCRNLEGSLPKTIRKAGEKDFKFSFFNYKNGTDADDVTIFRGIKNLKKVGQILSFNNDMSINKWNDKYCDMLNGSDGSQFPVNLKSTDLIYIFQPDFCRSLFAKFEKEVFREQVKLLRFVNTPDLLAAPDENPLNECFCSPKSQITDFIEGREFGADAAEDLPAAKTCMKKGAMLLTPCLGAPVVLTFPHFYMADESFLDYAALNPVKELHETFAEVEPMSGIPVAASKRVQFNIEVRQIDGMKMMSNLTSGLFPILWVEERVQLTAKNFGKLRRSLWKMKLVRCITYGIGGLGAFLLVVAVLLNAKMNRSLCWEINLEATEAHVRQRSRVGAYGLYFNDAKGSRPCGGSQTLSSDAVKENRSRLDYPILIKRKAGRIFPYGTEPAAFGENFI